MIEKTPPHNTMAERSVLGSLLINADGLNCIADHLLTEDFYHDAHRAIYEAILALDARSEIPQFVTICHELEQMGKLESSGGDRYVMQLIDDLPTSYGVEEYARIILEEATKRRLLFSAGQMAALAQSGTTAKDALEQAERLLFGISKRTAAQESFSLKDIAGPYMDRLNMLHEQQAAIVGVPTGFRLLDKLTGGLQKSTLNVLAARPGVGKTALALNIARNAAARGHGTAFYSLEMSKEELFGRLLSSAATVDSQRLRFGHINDREWDPIVRQLGKLEDLPLWIDDTGRLSTTALRSKARRLCSEQQVDLLIVDYLQLMTAYTDDNKRYRDQVQEVSEISAALKALSKELAIPVLALSQLSRAVESRADKRPQLSDLRQSGSIEQDSDIVMFLYREELYDDKAPKGKTELIIEKHRNGPVGDISLHFEEAQTLFTDVEVAR